MDTEEAPEGYVREGEPFGIGNEFNSYDGR
jgi:hypothetical protein